MQKARPNVRIVVPMATPTSCQSVISSSLRCSLTNNHRSLRYRMFWCCYASEPLRRTLQAAALQQQLLSPCVQGMGDSWSSNQHHQVVGQWRNCPGLSQTIDMSCWFPLTAFAPKIKNILVLQEYFRMKTLYIWGIPLFGFLIYLWQSRNEKKCVQVAPLSSLTRHPWE